MMIKKISYIKPELKVRAIEEEDLLAASPRDTIEIKTEGNGILDNSNSIGAKPNNGSFWDDDKDSKSILDND